MSSPLKQNTTDLQELLEVVNNLPKHLDTADANATASDILSDRTAYVNGKRVTGTMANNGAISKTMDGVTTKSVSVPAGYTSGGTVSMDDTVDNAVTAALSALVDKGVEVPSGTNVTGLADLITAIEAGGVGDVDLSDMTFCRFVYVTPSKNITTKLTLQFNVPADCMFAIGIANRNGITLESNAVVAGLNVSLGWHMRLVATKSVSTGYAPYAVNNYVSFSDMAYLQAGITYKYVIIGK